MTLGDGESVHSCLRQPTTLAPPDNIPQTVQKYRKFTDPETGTVRTHYGKTYDARDFEGISHGHIFSDKNDVSLLFTIFKIFFFLILRLPKLD